MPRVLHLNAYKIGNSTILACLADEGLTITSPATATIRSSCRGQEPLAMHTDMAAAFDTVVDHIASIRAAAKDHPAQRPRWQMIVLRTPGLNRPKEVDGKAVKNHWRSHQVPVSGCRSNAAHLDILEAWMRSSDSEDLSMPMGT